MTLSRISEKSTKVRQSEHIFVNSSLEASSFIHSYPKIFKCCWKVQIFVGGQNELTLVTLSQNSRKINKNSQNEHFFGNFCLQASTCIHSYKRIVNFCRKLQILRVTKEITSMNLSQNVKQITQFRQSEHIFGRCCHQASSCIHFYPETIKVWWKKSNFLGGQKELALMTLSRNSKKLTKTRRIEHMFVNFRLQASSPVRSYPIKANYCRKLQFFLGGWKELTLMTLSQTIGKITKVRQKEHIFGSFCHQASSCIHSNPKKN